MNIIKRIKDGKYWTGKKWNQDIDAAVEIVGSIAMAAPLHVIRDYGKSAILFHPGKDLSVQDGWFYWTDELKNKYAEIIRVETLPQ